MAMGAVLSSRSFASPPSSGDTRFSMHYFTFFSFPVGLFTKVVYLLILANSELGLFTGFISKLTPKYYNCTSGISLLNCSLVLFLIS